MDVLNVGESAGTHFVAYVCTRVLRCGLDLDICMYVETKETEGGKEREREREKKIFN